jgi:hypothetical protein
MSEWTPTHWVPETGLEARSSPDPAVAPVARLDPWLEVAVAQVWGDWAQVVCSNGWWAWVDGRVLVPRTATALPGPTPSTAPGAVSPSATGTQGSGEWSAEAFAARALAGAIGLVGALAIALSALLPWLRLGGESANGFDVPVEFLLSYDSSLDTGIKLGLLLILLGVAGLAAVVLFPDPRWRRGVGIAAVAIAVVYVVQVQRALGAGPAAGRPSLLSAVGFGVYVALVGGLALAFAPMLPRAGVD